MPQALTPWSGYVELLAQAERIFRRMVQEHPDLVRCKLGCDDCCQAPFRLSLIEAVAIKTALDSLDRPARRAARLRAEKGAGEAERAFDDLPTDASAAALALAKKRLRCPLLDEKGCAVYPARPLTCRLYGLPTASAGQSHTCPRSGFEPGESYPTVNLDPLFDHLAELSLALVKQAGLSQMMLAPQPVAQVILTDYPLALRPVAMGSGSSL